MTTGAAKVLTLEACGHGNLFGEGQAYYGARSASFFCKILTTFRKGGSVLSDLFQASTIPLTARQTSVWELSGFSLTEQAAFHRIFILLFNMWSSGSTHNYFLL